MVSNQGPFVTSYNHIVCSTKIRLGPHRHDYRVAANATDYPDTDLFGPLLPPIRHPITEFHVANISMFLLHCLHRRFISAV